MEEETTRFCGNCKKDVVSSNFSLHEVHCKRFLRLCPDCGESVPDKDMKEHQNENHRKVRCDLCYLIIQQYLLEEHKATECDERLVICHFCELQMPHCKLQEHVDGCGSRTQLCPDCKKYIMYKNLDQHKDNCLAVAVQPDTSTQRKDIKKKLRCPKCSILLTESTFLSHQNECNPLSQFQGASSKKPGSNANTFRPISPVLQPWSEFRSSLLDEPETQIHDKVDNVKFQEYSFRSRYSSPFLKERSTFMEGALARSSSMNKQTSQLSPEDELAYDVLKACTRCNVLLPSPTLKQHEDKCNLLCQFQGTSSKQAERNANTFRPIAHVFHSWSDFRSSLLKESDMKISDNVDNEEFQGFSFQSQGVSSRSTSVEKTNCQSGDEYPNETLKACTRCSVLLPSPTLKQHEKKCIYRGSLPSPY